MKIVFGGGGLCQPSGGAGTDRGRRNRGDRRKTHQALCMDPAIQDWSVAPPALDELLQATATYLPLFR